MLKKMYESWGNLHSHEGILFFFFIRYQYFINIGNYKVNEIEVAEAPVGIRNASIQICGDNVYGLLKVRIFCF